MDQTEGDDGAQAPPDDLKSSDEVADCEPTEPNPTLAAIDDHGWAEDESAQRRAIFDLLLSIGDVVEQRLSRDEAKERAFDRLYRELDELKRDRAFEEHKPLFLDLLLLDDRIEASKGKSASRQELLESLQLELREILARRDIEPIVSISDEFCPDHQKAVGVTPVEDSRLQGRVVQVVRQGFEHRGRVLRPQEVLIGEAAPADSPVISDVEK